jgi:DNA-binding transcriptional regulator YhcF (GntR family)
MSSLLLEHDNKISKIELVTRSIANDIERGVLKPDERLPSVNEFNEKFKVSRDTVWKAYKKLESQGYIFSRSSAGFFAVGPKQDKIKIVLIFNKLSSYKKIVYDSFLKTVGERANVDLYIHQYNPKVFREIIEKVKGNYHYYVVMPHFFESAQPEEYLPVIESIPKESLLLLDKNLATVHGNYLSVYQDFKQDIFNALQSANDLLQKYDKIIVVFPPLINHTPDILEGVKAYCKKSKLKFAVKPSVGAKLILGAAYIVVTDEDLASIIKIARRDKIKLGKDVGIISFNETVLKEVLDITVVTTDFEEMGHSSAQLILNRENRQVKNPFLFIRRKSL